ncbi:MAG: hypothetical protein AAF806_25895, partial [Bacteroidota bacterium]
MKLNIFISISILTVSLNCQNTNLEPEGNWIVAYSLLEESSPMKGLPLINDTIRLKKIIRFEEDSMAVASFNETLYYGFDERKLKFNLGKDSIILEHEVAIDYSYNNGLLAIDFYGSSDSYSKYIDHFIQIDDYEMAHKQEEISFFLTNNPIIIG